MDAATTETPKPLREAEPAPPTPQAPIFPHAGHGVSQGRLPGASPQLQDTRVHAGERLSMTMTQQPDAIREYIQCTEMIQALKLRITQLTPTVTSLVEKMPDQQVDAANGKIRIVNAKVAPAMSKRFTQESLRLMLAQDGDAEKAARLSTQLTEYIWKRRQDLTTERLILTRSWSSDFQRKRKRAKEPFLAHQRRRREQAPLEQP